MALHQKEILNTLSDSGEYFTFVDYLNFLFWLILKKINQKTEYGQSHKWNQLKSKDVTHVTGDCESCQNEISALITHVNGIDFALR